ncbi:MAG TPA: DNA-binding domain-containing protein [Chromatiaceae bacterium]|nr:DNA-binding domain-containing protein [Chromatiaceae bacterium]
MRFGVYRNSVAVSLAGVPADTFPVTRELVGDAFVEAMARCFVAAEPPRSPSKYRYRGIARARFSPTRSRASIGSPAKPNAKGRCPLPN